MTGIVLRICSVALLLLSCLGAWCAGADAPRPNILIILADDLGYSDLGCYGGEIRTPQLDQLAAGGLRYTQCYNTARCWPSRAALLTGYYAQQVRRDDLPGLKRSERPELAPLLPALLRPLGYRSYHSGKWHLDGLALPNGFDRSYDLRDQGRFFSPQAHAEDDVPLPPVSRDSGYYATTAIADHAIRCLSEHAAQHADRPFFQYVAFTAPHFPLHALPEDIERYRQTYVSGWDEIRLRRWGRIQELGLVDAELSSVEREIGPPYHFPEALEQLGAGEINRPVPWSSLTNEQRAFQATKMAIHAAMVDRMDQEIGRLLDQLRAMQAFDDTLILFLSDNGASAEIMVRHDGHDPQAPPGSAATHLCLGPGWSTVANTPFRRHKTWVHEGGVCTPLIAHWPRGIADRGELRTTPAHLIDVVPTLLELAGADLQQIEDSQNAPARPGISLTATFASSTPLPERPLWWSHEGNRALRLGDWKLVAAKDEPWELFNLATDRTESHNLASEQPELVRDLEQRWQALADEFVERARD
jgi:arylsulfatase A-like enzyme